VIKALLFDFDGTLIDTESIDLRSWREIFDRHGVELPEERFALRIGTIGGPDELDELDALLDEPCDREAVRTARQARELELLALEPLRPGIESYLDDAHRLGLSVAIVSSSSRRWIAEGLERLGRTDRWTCIVAADGDRERAKPAPTLYVEALDALGVEPHDAVAFEDSPNGVAAAKAAGIFCVAVPNPVTARLDLSSADLVLESFEDLTLEELLDRVG
jgi:HAD superfamily hydrolase (TIGR01509 family)